MDPVSHAALGAAWAQPSVRGPRLLAAAIVGAIAAMTPDLDFLIRSSGDPLLGLEYHRNFTHSLAFIPIGALLCAWPLHRLFRSRLSFAQCYLLCLLGYGSHGLLDACTTYGTLLFWPFSRTRVAWNVVSAVDPLFTLPLLALAVISVYRRATRYAAAGVCWAILYLGIGVVQHERALAAGAALAAARGDAAVRIHAGPAIGTLLVWRVIYESAGRYYIDAVRTGAETRVFDGVSVAKLDVERDFPWLGPGTQQARDLDRFRWFTSGWLAIDPQHADRVVDLRFALVPNTADGFWAIVLDPKAGPDAHVGYVTERRRTLAEGGILLAMILGSRTTGTDSGEISTR